MGFSLVVKKLFVFLKVSLLCAAVFMAAYNIPIEEINPQKKLDYLLPNHRTPWTTDHFDEQRVYEEVRILRSLNRMLPFFFRRNVFATTGKAAADQDQSKLDEVVQSLSGNCIIEDLSSFFDDFSYICYKFFSRKSPFERRRGVSTCLARRKYIRHPLQWMSDFSDMLHRSCEVKTNDLDSGSTQTGDDVMFKVELVYLLLVGVHSLQLASMTLWSIGWIKEGYNQAICSFFQLNSFHCRQVKKVIAFIRHTISCKITTTFSRHMLCMMMDTIYDVRVNTNKGFVQRNLTNHNNQFSDVISTKTSDESPSQIQSVENGFEKVSCSTTSLLKDHNYHQLSLERTNPTQTPDQLQQTVASAAAPLLPVGWTSWNETEHNKSESSLHLPVDNKHLLTSVTCKTSSYKSKANSESNGDRLEASSTDSFSQAGSKVSDTTKSTFHTGGSVSKKSPTFPTTFVDYRFFRDTGGLDPQNGLEHGCAQPGIIRPVPIHHQPSTIRGHMPKLNVVLPQSGRLLKAPECRNKPASSTTWLQTELMENDVYNYGKIREKQTEAIANDEILFVDMEARHNVTQKMEEKELFSLCQQNNSSEDESSINFTKNAPDVINSESNCTSASNQINKTNSKDNFMRQQHQEALVQNMLSPKVDQTNPSLATSVQTSSIAYTFDWKPRPASENLCGQDLSYLWFDKSSKDDFAEKGDPGSSFPLNNTRMFCSTPCISSHQGKVIEEKNGQRLMGASSDSFAWNKQEISKYPKCVLHHCDFSSEESPSPSTPPVADYRWSNTQQRIEFGFDHQNMLRPVPIHHQPSTVTGILPKLRVVLPQSGKLASGFETRDKPTSHTTLESSMKTFHNFSKHLEINNKISAVDVESKHEIAQENNTILNGRQYSPSQQSNISKDESLLSVIQNKEDKEVVDVFVPFESANTEHLPSSPPSIVEFLPSPYPCDSPPLQPVRNCLLDWQNHQTNQSPLTQEDFDLSMSTSTSSTSLHSYNYQNEDNEWLSGETSDRWSDSSSVTVSGSEISQISIPSLHQNLNSSSSSETDISLKIKDCFTSTTTNPSINHCASPPHVLRSIVKPADEEVVKSPTSIKQYFIFNGQENTKANKLAKVVLPTNSQNSVHSIGFTENSGNQGVTNKILTSSIPDHHGASNLSEITFSFNQNEQNCFKSDINFQFGFLDPDSEIRSIDEADRTTQSGRNTFVISDDGTETPLPPSPPTIIDYLNYDDFETPQEAWSEAEQMFFSSTHRQTILKPQVTRLASRANMLTGNALKPDAELPRLKVVLPETGALASNHNYRDITASSFTVVANSLFKIYEEKIDDLRNSVNDVAKLKKHVTGRNAWKDSSHDNFFNWLPQEIYPRRFNERDSLLDHPGMPGTVNGKVDPIFTSNQDNFGMKRSNYRNNVLWKHHPTQPGPGFIPSNVKQSTSFPVHTEKTSSNLYFTEWKPKEICDNICNRDLSYLWFNEDYDQTIFDQSSSGHRNQPVGCYNSTPTDHNSYNHSTSGIIPGYEAWYPETNKCHDRGQNSSRTDTRCDSVNGSATSWLQYLAAFNISNCYNEWSLMS